METAVDDDDVSIEVMVDNTSSSKVVRKATLELTGVVRPVKIRMKTAIVDDSVSAEVAEKDGSSKVVELTTLELTGAVTPVTALVFNR